MKIIYFGNGLRGETCFSALLKAKKNIIAVIGHPGESDLIKLAKKENIITFQPEDLNDQRFIRVITPFKADLFILVGYNKILKKEIIKLPSRGIINLHGGRLPYYRGAAPINWQLINGEKVGGFSIFYVDEGTDTGDIIHSTEFPIGINDTADDLIQRSLKWFPKNLIQVINNLEKGIIVSKKQNNKLAHYYPRRHPEDGRIFWDKMNDVQVHNLVRALVPPYPGAFSYLKKEKIIILKSKLLKKEIKGESGRIMSLNNKGMIVITSNRGILVKEILVDNKKYPAANFLKTGDKFQSMP